MIWPGAIALAAAAASGLAPADFCADLERALAAARETPAFASWPVAGEPVAAMGFAECGPALLGPALLCLEDHSDSVARFEALRSAIADCRPNARPWTDPRRSPSRPDERRIELIVGRVLISLHETGSIGEAKPYVSMQIEPAPKRARRPAKRARYPR